MRVAEIVFVVIAFIGLIMEAALIKGGSIIFLFAMLGLIGIYFYLSFALLNGIRFRDIFKKASYQNVSRNHIVASVCMGFAMSIIATGLLFTIMRWKGAFIEILMGLMFITIPLIISVSKYLSTKHHFYLRILKRAVPLYVLGLVIYNLPWHFWEKITYRNHPAYIQAMERAEENPTLENVMESDRQRHIADSLRYNYK